MLETRISAENPKSIFNVVDRQVLTELMQAFFLRERSGVVLAYDEIVEGRRELHFVEPTSDQDSRGSSAIERENHFNPFCHYFRRERSRDQLCVDCDIKRAELVFAMPDITTDYKCHIGLTDLTIPIRLSGRVRAVLFGGQLIPDVELEVAKIKSHVNSIENIAQNERTILESLIGANRKSGEDIALFKSRFQRFAKVIQDVIDAFQSQQLQIADRAALLSVSESLSMAHLGISQSEEGVDSGDEDRFDVWCKSAQRLCSQLSDLLEEKSVRILIRRGSHYECVGSSDMPEVTGKTIPARCFMKVVFDQTIEISFKDAVAANRQLMEEMKAKMGINASSVSIVRVSVPISKYESISAAIVMSRCPPLEKSAFLIDLTREIANSVCILAIIERSEFSKRNIEKRIRYLGHTLKTPLSIALRRLESLVEAEGSLASTIRSKPEYLFEAIGTVSEQITIALADAIILKDIERENLRQVVAFDEVVERVKDGMRHLAVAREIDIIVTNSPPANCKVYVSPTQLRIAIRNLLDNAIKYSYEKKTVNLSYWTDSENGMSLRNSKRHLTLKIVNYGIGFPKERQADLFKLGTRLYQKHDTYKRSGEGVGLVMVKEFAEDHGGSIEIDCELIEPRSIDSGGIWRTVVQLTLPLVNS